VFLFDQITTLGFYWLVPAMLFSPVIAITDSWVPWVEINR